MLTVLPDDSPDLQYSPLLRAARLTLQFSQDNGGIGLTASGAFKRVFVLWAADQFDWPGMGPDELFAVNRVLNEYDFVPLEILHFILVRMKLGRHYKGTFRVTKRGAEFLSSPGALFAEMIPFFLFELDHTSYARFEDRPIGNWDVWLNFLNVEVDQGARAGDLFEVLYGPVSGEENDWRAFGAFRQCVLEPLRWAGLLAEVSEPKQRLEERHYAKTPLWRFALSLDTGEALLPPQLH